MKSTKRIIAACVVFLFCCVVLFASNSGALSTARSYIKFMGFSAEGLKEQLKFEGFTESEADYAVANCGANWNEEAVESAESYLRLSSFSRQGLIEQLEYEGFTHSQAQYGVDKALSNKSINSTTSSSSDNSYWNEQAVESAKSYLKYSSFSEKGLMEQLEYEGFTHSQAQYGVEHCGADWNEQAVKSAKSYLRVSSFSKQELINQLEYEGFTSSQAQYGVNNAF